MRMDKDQFRKYKSLTYSEQRKARRYMRRGMDVDDALYEADETGRFLMKILLWILFIAGVVFGGYKLVKWVLNTVAKDCTHETLTYMRSNTFDEIGYFRCVKCATEFEFVANAKVKERVEPTCQKTGYVVRLCYYDIAPDVTYEKYLTLPVIPCQAGELVSAAIPANCTTDGHSDIYECSMCHEEMEYEVYPQNGECFYEVNGKYDPTCYSEGSTGNLKCRFCETQQGDPIAIPIVDHFVLEENKTHVEGDYIQGTHAEGPCIYCNENVRVDYTSEPGLASLFTYTIDKENNEAILTEYIGLQSEVFIPASINGYPIKKISDSLFENNTTIESITLAEGIEVIGKNAFKNAEALKELKVDGVYKENSKGEIFFPDSLITIEDGAFDGCKTLRRIHFNNVTYIGVKAFANCVNLRVVEFADAEAYPQNEAFLNCNKIIFFKTPTNNISARNMILNGYTYFDLEKTQNLGEFLGNYVELLSSTPECYFDNRCDYKDAYFEDVVTVSENIS